MCVFMCVREYVFVSENVCVCVNGRESACVYLCVNVSERE